MTDSDTPSQERDGRPAAQQSDTDAVDTAAPSDTSEDPRVAAAMDEADDALDRAAEAHDDYREAITDAIVALDELDRLHGRDVPGESVDTPDRVSEADLDTTAAPEYTDGTGHLELYHTGQVLVRAARTLKRSRVFPSERAAGLVQTSARASVHLCHEDVPENALADVATEALEGVGDLADLARDSDATAEQVAAAATELFEILSKVEEVRAAADARSEHGS
jgi:hypothetical protein